MARLFTVPFETQQLTATVGRSTEPGVSISGSPTIDTTLARSGAACAKLASGSTNYAQLATVSTLGRAYYYRFAYRFTGFPASTGAIARLIDSTGTVLELTVTSGGKLEMWNAVAAAHPAGESPPTLETGRWYVIEVMLRVNSEGKGKLAWRLDGTTIAAEQEMSVRNLGINTFRVGNINGGAFVSYTDDWAVNDDQGADENSWAGHLRKIAVLRPIADKARVGWTGGAGGTTNLYDALDNIPPVGVVLGSATNTSQIKDANNNSTDTLELSMAKYSSSVASGGAGLIPPDDVKVLGILLRGGQNSATGRGLGITLVSNPAKAEVAGGMLNEVAEADPVGWRTITNIASAFTYNPSVEKDVSPVVKIRKSVSTTDAVMVDQVLLLVEYEPGTEYTDSGSGTATGSGSGEGVHAGDDSGAGTATASGSGTELAAGEDTGSGTVTASGSGVSETAGDGPTYRSVVLEDKPLLYWRLNEAGNTEAEDMSGHGRSGEYRNEAALGATGALEGDPDNAVALDEAKAGYVKGLTYDPFSGTKTFEIWAKRKAGSHEKEDVIFGGSNGGGAGVFAYIKEGTDNIRLTINGFGTTATWEHAWPTDEGWVHLVFVINPSTLKATLYVNGVSKGEKTISAYGGTAGNVRISHDNGTGGIKGAFPGWLDEFAIYEGVLSAERVKAHYDAGTRAPAAPRSRCLWGADMDGDVALLEGEPKARGDAPYDTTTWDLFEAHAGRDVEIVHFSDQWKEGVGPVWDGFGSGVSDLVRSRGAIPMKTIGGPANVLKDTLAGVYDDGFTAWAEAAAEFGDAVLLRPWWEFNLSEGTWAWSGSARAADHKAAWRHLYNLIKPIAPNVLFVWCPNVIVSGTTDLSPWFPGVDYIDWTAMDGYSGTNPAKSVGWRSAHKLFRPTYDHLIELAPDAPIAICEVATSEIGGSKPVWTRNLLGEAIQENMPQIRALVWFNWNIDHGAGRVDWPIESSPAATAAFKAGIASSYYGNPLHIDVEPADLPLPTRAQLFGEVDPGGLPATYWYEYGETIAYGSETEHRELGILGVAQEADELLKGLKPGHTYHFRLIAENERGQVVSEDQSFTLARVPQLHVRELMPMDVTILATTPGGKTHRWAEDGAVAGKILEGMTDSGSVPGGNNKFAASLPRKLGVDYGDMKRGTRVDVFGAGQMPLSVFRLGRAPQVSGDKLVVSPDASGYEAHLLDDNTAQEIFVDADQGAWWETSARRRGEVPSNKYTNAQVQLLPAGAPDPEDPTSFSTVPAISHSWTNYDNSAGPDVAESWYDALGVELGEILLDFEAIKGITPGDTNWNDQVYTSIDGIVLQELLADLNATATVAKALAVPAGRFALMLRDYFGGAKEGAANIETQWRNVRVRGRSGLPLYGIWPEVGVLASDVAAFVLGRWCPEIAFTTGRNGTIQPSRFIIPHLVFKGPTNAADMIQRATRFELPEWGVWATHRGPTFFMNRRGEREGRKRWRVRSHEAEFEETGQQMDLVWNGVMVEGTGTDGSTLFIGPPDSGLRYTSDRLVDTDPTNPVNELGGKRYAKIQMRGIATIAGMVEAGEAFLEHCRLLDASGRTTLTGYIEDDHGKRWPYYCAEAGDQIEWIGSSVPGYRYIVNADRNRSSRSVSIDIDAPPDNFEAMMERLNARFVGVGFESG